MREQIFINDYRELNNQLKIGESKSILVVCDKFLLDSFFLDFLKKLNVSIHTFTDFKPNPKYEEVLEGIKIFKENNCDLIIAVGGGSAIDVAKCIRSFSTLDEKKNYLQQKIMANDIPLLAVPTTAGTGSESTHFAVIYYDGVKYSVDDSSVLPNYVLLEAKFLESLPLYQKKSTLLDALCQGIESYWSVNSTDESKKYAKLAISGILKNYQRYIAGDNSVNDEIMKAANYSGRAINISKTTAAHAMSYKITSLYGISHGHAVAVCLPHIWEYMIDHINDTHDARGAQYLDGVFNDLDAMFGTVSHRETIAKLIDMYDDIDIPYTGVINVDDLEVLTKSVNVDRLKNNPISLDVEVIENIYKKLI